MRRRLKALNRPFEYWFSSRGNSQRRAVITLVAIWAVLGGMVLWDAFAPSGGEDRVCDIACQSQREAEIARLRAEWEATMNRSLEEIFEGLKTPVP